MFVAASFACALAVRAAAEEVPVERWLELTNTHTGDVVKATFRDAQGYVEEALTSLRHVLRDHRTNEEHEMDPALYDQLSDLALTARREPRYEIISGYRSPATNAKLHAQSQGVSEKRCASQRLFLRGFASPRTEGGPRWSRLLRAFQLRSPRHGARAFLGGLATEPRIMAAVIAQTSLLLVASNIFMTFAWYAHLKNLSNRAWYVAALVSWGIALFEYLLQVPANRIGYTQLSLPQLKILQEVITLGVFVPFAVFYMQKPLKLDYLWAALCMLGAVYFIFRGPERP
jgi:uncharacterized protein (DUF486 family)